MGQDLLHCILANIGDGAAGEGGCLQLVDCFMEIEVTGEI
jgi:hypothetical protein